MMWQQTKIIEKYIDEGKFRADLYFRINVFPIVVPSLAERIVDIPVIVEFMLTELKKDPQSFDLNKILAMNFICQKKYKREFEFV